MDFLVLLEADFDVLESRSCHGHCSYVNHSLHEADEADESAA
ncbi:hypothetical protein [Treponema putidum]